MKLGENDIKLYLGSAEVDKVYLGTTQVYPSEEPTPVPYEEQYLTIESLEDNNTVYLKASSAGIAKTVSASTDNGATWTEYTSSTGGSGTTLATLNTGDKLLVKGENSVYGKSTSRGPIYNKFTSTGQFKVKGNIMSLIYGDNFIGQTSLSAGYTFYSLFNNSPTLISAENLVLPTTTLANNCYQSMFRNCTSLTTAPELPATTLADSCYSGMFNGCTSITTAPQLPATTLAQYCYIGMFGYCTSLITAPELPATTLAMGCYQSMFDDCTSLTTAPELPTTTLAEYCYFQMFRNCTSLNYIKCLATNTSVTYCTLEWTLNVSSSGTFVKAASMTSWTTGDSGIPTGWTVQDDDGGIQGGGDIDPGYGGPDDGGAE